MKNIFVGNLPLNVAEDEVRRLFEPFGQVNQVRIMIDSHTDKSRGFGFVEMANAEDGERAIAALNGTLLGDRALKVDDARPRSDIPRFRGSRRR
jgi:RNA recognition motif-containing protein